MNKLFTKITSLALGAAMMIGVGVSVASRSNVGKADAAVANWAAVNGGWANQETIPNGTYDFDDDTNVKISFTKGGSNTAYYTTGGVRVYNGGNFTVTSTGGNITSIALSYTLNGSATLSADVGTLSGQSWTGNSAEVVFSAGTEKHVRLASLAVTYSGGGDTPDPEEDPLDGKTGTINFGNAEGSTMLSTSNLSGDDSLSQTWNGTDVWPSGNTKSYTNNATYTQIGASANNKRITSISFEMTLEKAYKVTAFSVKTGGYAETSGTATLKVGDTTVGTGEISSSDTVLEATDTTQEGTVLSVVLASTSGMRFKLYYISYSLEAIPETTDDTTTSLSVTPSSWSGFNTDTINLSSYTVSCETTASDDGYVFQGIGSGVGDNFVGRDADKSSFTPKTTDTRLQWKAKYPQTAGGDTYLYAYVSLTVEADTISSVSASVADKAYYATNKLSVSDFTVSAEWSHAGQKTVTSDFTWTVNGVTDGTLSYGSNTVIVTYEGVTSDSISVNATYVPGTVDNPYTVAQARAAIDAGTGVTNVYATGVVTEIPTAWSTEHSNITFNFKDKTSDSNFLQAYRCKSGDADASKVAIGDTVVVYGNLTKFGSTYEFAQNCELHSLSHPTTPSVTFTQDYGNILVGQNKTYEAVTANLGSATVSYTSSNTGKATIDQATGEITAVALGDTTITASATVNNVVYSDSFTLHVVEPKTVAQARSFIDLGENLKDNYVTGKISQVDTYENGTITYWISDNGTTTDQLEVYKGKGVNDASFTAKTDISVGATVIVWGELTLYNSIYEFKNGNYQISYTAPVVSEHTVTYNANGGECAVSTEKISSGGHPTFPTPTKTDYTFDGWQVNGEGTYYTSENASSYTVEGDVTFIAHWTSSVQPTGNIVEFVKTGDQLTSGYTLITTNVGTNADYYQDKNSNTGLDFGFKKSSGALWTTDVPTTRTLTVTVGGGSTKDSLTNNLVAYYLNSNYEIISSTETIVTTKVENKTGSDYEVTMPATQNVYGIMLHHEKETGYNVRVYGFTFEFASDSPTPSGDQEIISGAFEFNSKQSVYVEDIGVMVVSAPEGFTELSSVGDTGYNFAGENMAYDSSSKTVSFDFYVYADTATADVEIEFYWYEDDSYSGDFLKTTATLQIVDPTGLSAARNFLKSVNAACDAEGTKDYSAVATAYAAIENNAEAKALLLAADYTVTGTGSDTVVTKADDTHYELAEGMSRYDELVSKHGMTNYLNKPGLPSGRIVNNLFGSSESTGTVVIIIISVIGVSALGGFFFLRKRKEI